jgi:ribosomal protein S27AE
LNAARRYDDDADLDLDLDDDDVELLTCPACGKDVYEDTEKCPHCGDWITPLAAHGRLPGWVRWVAAGVLAVIVIGLMSGILRWF